MIGCIKRVALWLLVAGFGWAPTTRTFNGG